MQKEQMEERISEILSGMSTRQKLAQMMIVSLRSDMGRNLKEDRLPPAYRELFAECGFGGVLLFEDNIETPEQTVMLLRDCQRAALQSESGIPMLFCVDQEGGKLNRFSFAVPGPGNMALAASGDPALTRECAGMIGEEIRALGFHLDFAPVADVNSNPKNPIIGVRSFSDDPAVAARHVTAYLEGLADQGIAACLKHFPGHGNVGQDSHTHLPLSELTAEELTETELIPFREGIKAGADLVMTAHIQYPKIETGTYLSKADGRAVHLPATLSRAILTGILREELGFEGVIVTDALDMRAIAAHFDEIDAASMAIRAGADILLIPVNLHQDETFDSFPRMRAYLEQLSEKVETGEVPAERLDESVRRILRLKYQKGIMGAPLLRSDGEQIAEAKRIVGCEAHRKKEWDMTQRGLTLVRSGDGVLPFGTGERTLILASEERLLALAEKAVGQMEQENVVVPGQLQAVLYDGSDSEEGVRRLVSEGKRQVVMITGEPSRNPATARVMEQVHRAGGKTVLVCAELPYAAALYPEADAVLCTYGALRTSITVALYAVFGKAKCEGRLPVRLPEE
ncbi:MAG: hypothetical protein IKS07_03745 [Lachnospiraceae bacterium]|nr:hypothetical protein [Lachnospiraceae bacterium]